MFELIGCDKEAFDLVPGDMLTFSVLGRVFTATVANIREEYHRTFRPEFLLDASPEPFRNAPHTWIVSLDCETDRAVDALVSDLARDVPNVTVIDVRQIVAEVTSIVESAAIFSLAIAGLLLVAGALTLTAVVVADVDSRERQALAFTLVGASRREIAMARLAEAGATGCLSALLGGCARRWPRGRVECCAARARPARTPARPVIGSRTVVRRLEGGEG